MSYRLAIRRDTAANWTAENPILGQGEMGFEYDANRMKIGDGVLAWNVLPYYIGVAGDTALESGTVATIDTLTVGTNANIAGNCNIAGNLVVSGSGTFTGPLTANGGLTLGGGSSVSIGGSFTTSGGTSDDWNTAFGWGDHAAAGYADGTNVPQWNNAHSWGNHALAGYALTAGATFTGEVIVQDVLRPNSVASVGAMTCGGLSSTSPITGTAFVQTGATADDILMGAGNTVDINTLAAKTGATFTGAVEATELSITGGTADDVLLADGTTTPVAGLGGGGGGNTVGDVKYSMLTPAQMALQDLTWVLANGSTCVGTDYNTLTGATNLPDLRGQFLRGLNDGRSDGNQNPDNPALGDYQADIFKSHSHNITSYYNNVVSGTAINAFSNNTTGPQVNTTATNGGPETRPKNVSMYIYIKVNN